MVVVYLLPLHRCWLSPDWYCMPDLTKNIHSMYIGCYDYSCKLGNCLSTPNISEILSFDPLSLNLGLDPDHALPNFPEQWGKELFILPHSTVSVVDTQMEWWSDFHDYFMWQSASARWWGRPCLIQPYVVTRPTGGRDNHTLSFTSPPARLNIHATLE